MILRALSVGAVLAFAGSALGQANFVNAGYTQNFDSMGASGTAAPIGWKHFTTGTGSNTTWTTTIPASGANSVASVPVSTAATTLTALAIGPTANNNSGYNVPNTQPTLNTTDRVLSTAPTTVAGAILQLELSNASGLNLPAGFVLTLNFDTVRFTTVSTPNELPGYWLFASADGTNWANVGTNPTIGTVPNTAGTTSSSVQYTLGANWNLGSSIYFRWVDDNANQTSPDQIIGLNNVSVVPAPGSLALLGIGGLVGLRRRR